MNVSLCCSYKEGCLLSYKSANKNMCSFITEIFSFEDKPTISHYSNRPKELIFAAVYSPGSYSNPSVTIRNDRLSVFLSKSNYSSAESLDVHEELLRKVFAFSYNSFEDHSSLFHHGYPEKRIIEATAPYLPYSIEGHHQHSRR